MLIATPVEHIRKVCLWVRLFHKTKKQINRGEKVHTVSVYKKAHVHFRSD